MSALLDARLAGCRRLFLTGFEVDAEIGIHPHELSGPQRMSFDVDIYVPLALSTRSDEPILTTIRLAFAHSALMAAILPHAARALRAWRGPP